LSLAQTQSARIAKPSRRAACICFTGRSSRQTTIISRVRLLRLSSSVEERMERPGDATWPEKSRGQRWSVAGAREIQLR
jgi:hypothetical protein